MRKISGPFHYVYQLASMLLSLIIDAVCYLGLCLRPSPTLAVENLFLPKQLTLYQERQVKLIHDRDAIFSKEVDQRVPTWGCMGSKRRTGRQLRIPSVSA